MNKTDQTISAYNESAQQFADRFMDFETYKNKIIYFQLKYLHNCKSILDLVKSNVSKENFTVCEIMAP